jgi:Ferredoxin-dependent bilin reductase
MKRVFPLMLSNIDDGGGLYRPFLEHAWDKLKQSGMFLSDDEGKSKEQQEKYSKTYLVPPDLATNIANAKGMPPGTQVRISIDAAYGKDPITYVRYALLETIPPPPRDDDVYTEGIQVLNFVIFTKPPFPVWGVDLVSLPGGRHLLTIDAQPMMPGQSSSTWNSSPDDDPWQDWYETHVQNTFPWGGDLPEDVQKFFSPHALWTRLIKDKDHNNDDDDDGVRRIRTHVFNAFCAHLDLFLKTIIAEEGNDDELKDNFLGTNHYHLEEYLDYRLANDPARPMLKSLYGADWTERVLHEILFNKERILR